MSYNSSNKKSFIERRGFERVYFSSEDDITCLIKAPGGTIPPVSGNISHLGPDSDINAANIVANISNLSPGGLYLILKKTWAPHFELGDNLVLKKIQATILFNLELNAGMEIKRLHNYEFVDRVGLGCKFTQLSEHARENIRRLVEWGLSRNGGII
ncbi:MAG: PilZ domain-containing protein [Desulfurivibrionaceae bacterium]